MNLFSKNKKAVQKEPHKIAEHWFFRTFSGEFKYTKKFPQNAKLILLNQERRAVLCPIHSKWERCSTQNGKLVFDCGLVNSDFLLDFSPAVLPKPESRFEFDEISGRDIEIPPSESQIEEFRYKNWNSINAENLDQNGINRDLVYIRIVDNISLSQIHIECVYLDRIRAQNRKKCLPAKLFQTAIRIEFSFDIKKNESRRRCLSSKEIPSSDIQEILPKNVEAFISELAKTIVRRNYGANLTLDYAKGGLSAIRAMMDFPFEPGLHDIKNALDCDFPVGKFDMNGYNSACKFLKIVSFSSLRKAYIQNPISLLIFKGLVQCGFTDKNLIAKTLEENFGTLFKWTSERSLRGLEIFCKTAISIRSEKSVLNMLEKNFRDAIRLGRPEICIDTANMAAQWLDVEGEYCAAPTKVDFDEVIDYLLAGTLSRKTASRQSKLKNTALPDVLRNDLMKNGLTRENHDTLMELEWIATHELISFKYLKKELALEDEIDGYSFRLPMDSKQLFEIGQNLHNCVGSYTERVRHHECAVLFAMKDGEYRLCIEVRDCCKVWQQRADFNANPKGQDAIVMQKWRKAHKLSFDGNKF